MDEKDVKIKNLEDKCNTFSKDLKELEVRINTLERKLDVEIQKVENLNLVLKDIKSSIDKIADKLDKIETRPSNLLWSVLGAVITALIVAGIKFMGN